VWDKRRQFFDIAQGLYPERIEGKRRLSLYSGQNPEVRTRRIKISAGRRGYFEAPISFRAKPTYPHPSFCRHFLV